MADYLQRHNLRALMDEWLSELSSRQPDDPFQALINNLELYRQGRVVYVTCENPWCEAAVLEAEYKRHLEVCSPSRWSKCIRCDQRVDVSKMGQHRKHCKMVSCVHCGEFVFPRMLALCPKVLMSKVRRRPLSPNREIDYSSGKLSARPAPQRRIQAMWRNYNARKRMEALTFHVVWNIMDSARETLVTKNDSRMGSFKAGSPSSVRSPAHRKQSKIDAEAASAALREMAQKHTVHEVLEILDFVENHQTLSQDLVEDICADAASVLRFRSTVTHVSTPFNGQCIVVGDLHGQLKDLLHIIHTEGLPNEGLIYIFNGDFVDRGPYGIEVLTLIFSMLCAFPGSVFLNRGNHEDQKTNSEYGFFVEIQTKYEDSYRELYNSILKTFKVMPLAHVLDKKYLIVHGGLPRHLYPLNRWNLLGHIRDVPTVEQQDEDEEMVVDLLWSDPVESFRSRVFGARTQGKNWRANSRGCGIEYLTDHTIAFLELNNLSMVIRSHEVVPAGYQVIHKGLSATVFSASDYCGVSGNRGAIAKFRYMEGVPTFQTWFLREGEAPMNLAASQSSMDDCTVGRPQVSGLEKESCLLQIRELVFSNRHKLMSSFSTLDVERDGYVTKVEFCEVIKRVLGLDLPWYYLCHFLLDTIQFNEVPCVAYANFLYSIDTYCGMRFRKAWIDDVLMSVFLTLDLPEDLTPPVIAAAASAGQSRFGGGSSRTNDLRRVRSDSDYEFSSSKRKDSTMSDASETFLDYNFFNSRLRLKSSRAAHLDDTEMFVLFRHFDFDSDGFIQLSELMESIPEEEDLSLEETTRSQSKSSTPGAIGIRCQQNVPRSPSPDLGLRDPWMYSALMNLQSVFLMGKERGIDVSFRLLDKDGNGSLDFGEFKKAIMRTNKILPVPLEDEQMMRIFSIIDFDKSGTVDLDEFRTYFSVRDMRTDELWMQTLRSPQQRSSIWSSESGSGPFDRGEEEERVG